MGILDGKVALVTGASRGIGRAIAVELGRNGVKVALNHHPKMEPAEVQASAEALAAVGATYLHVYGDVSAPDDPPEVVQRVLGEWGRLDILVNNAGVVHDRSLRKMTKEEWQEVINVDLNSVFYCTSAVIPVMVEQNYGRIVSISSVVAEIGNFGQANYSAAKAGIIGFTKTAALELARYNITANTICPGFTATSMTATIPPDVMEQIKAKIPLGRLGRPEEVADAVLFLVRSEYITGHHLDVNGGLHM